MVISTRAKLVITALILFFLLGVVLVTGSTKGWFVPQRFNGERVAARIQHALLMFLLTPDVVRGRSPSCTVCTALTLFTLTYGFDSLSPALLVLANHLCTVGELTDLVEETE
ncbi:hypothetical protein ACLKA6_004384 [Drosophila palustris]